MQIHNKPSLKSIRQDLRNNATEEEVILWKHLKGSQLLDKKFRRQHSIGNYIADFYCPECKLILEIDGEVHLTTGAIEKDKHRDENLAEMGFRILRIKNKEIRKDILAVLEKIKKAL
jgi:very-short-patch-repair endonuclease